MQTQAVQLLDDGAAEMAIPADDPFARGGLVGFGKGGAGYPGQAFHKLEPGGLRMASAKRCAYSA